MGQNERVPSLLLIEDDDAIRTALELSLTRQGHRVATAASGEDGLQLLREQRPDLIVLDVMLPGIDGFEVCRRIRRTDQLPIILLTARSDDIDVVVGLESTWSSPCRAGCWTPGSARCCAAGSASPATRRRSAPWSSTVPR
jgi:CheY-like chemotaxis protein